MHLPAGPVAGVAAAPGRGGPIAVGIADAACRFADAATFVATAGIVIYRTAIRIGHDVPGIHRPPVATPRRFLSPQPLRCGRIGGVVHQPAGTTGGTASAPPPLWRWSIVRDVRWGGLRVGLRGPFSVSLHPPSSGDLFNSLRTRSIGWRGLICSLPHPAAHGLDAVASADARPLAVRCGSGVDITDTGDAATAVPKPRVVLNAAVTVLMSSVTGGGGRGNDRVACVCSSGLAAADGWGVVLRDAASVPKRVLLAWIVLEKLWLLGWRLIDANVDTSNFGARGGIAAVRS